MKIAYGSLKETKYLLHFIFTEKHIKEKDYKILIGLAEELGKLLWTSIQNLKE